MNRLLWFFCGYEVVKICGASPQWTLNTLTLRRIPFWDLKWEDPLEVQISVFRRDFAAVEQAAADSQCNVTQKTEAGYWKTIRRIARRPVLLLAVVLAVLSLWLIPKFLLFYEVSGNETVPDQQILRELEKLGIGFGTYGANLNPRWIKDHMLNTIDRLQWITVTQNGCKAKVIVRERPETPKTIDRKGYAHVVATQSGLVTQMSVLAGQPVVQPGDFVLEGDLLVSGLVDADRVFLMEYAQAEIFARTWRKSTVVIPQTTLEKEKTGEEFCCIWLEIGNHRIKIFGNSGISTVTCDKMINRKILTLPDGSVLPTALLVERLRPWQGSPVTLDREATSAMLTRHVEQTILQRMQAGEILSHQVQLQQRSGCFVLSSVAECREMIARTVEAKWSEEDFADD